MKKHSLPVVSIVGRPNVGKSSLFNRFVGKRHAVIEEKEGTTRDRNEKELSLGGKSFVLVDTGGFLSGQKDEMTGLVEKQIKKAIEFSDLFLFVCDGEKGPMPLDIDLSELLRKSGKKIILVVNKMDNEKRTENLPEFYVLGLGDPVGISCLHNLGIDKVLEEFLEDLPEKSQFHPRTRNPIKIAIVGRPNVGKSSFLNRVLDEERVIVHEEPGTTRDSIDSYFEKDGLSYLLIDTAGMRHKRKVKKAVDMFSMMRAKDSIDHSDVAFLLVDGMEGVTNDDGKIFDYIRYKGKGCAIIVNKWDLVKGVETSRYKNAIYRKMPEAENFPVAFISAKTGRNVLTSFHLATTLKTNLDLFINPEELKDFLEEINLEQVSIPRRERGTKFFYIIQSQISPKEFIVFVGDPRFTTDFHTSFIENRLRERFPLEGVPIRIMYRRLRKKKTKPQRTKRGPKC